MRRPDVQTTVRRKSKAQALVAISECSTLVHWLQSYRELRQVVCHVRVDNIRPSRDYHGQTQCLHTS